MWRGIFFIIRIIFLLVLMSFGLYLGREIGIWYHHNIFVFLPQFLADKHVNLFICAMILLYVNTVENKHIWGIFMSQKATAIGCHDPAPISLSVITGFYSAWLNSERPLFLLALNY